MPSYPITTPVSDLPFDMRQTFAGEFVFVKNAYIAYLLDQTAFNPVTDTDYPGYHSYTVTSITRTLQVATVTTSAPTALETGDTVVIAGADQTEYNGTFTITVTDSTHFTYTVTGTPVTPATGSITLEGGPTTVRGVVYLGDYMFVCTVRGELHNSNRSDYATWDALDFTTPENEPSLVVAIAKTLNFVGVFKQWDTEFAYNAQLPGPGSPLLFQDSAYLKLGCASAESLVEFDGGIILITKRDQKQRSREVHVINGLTPQKISTPEVERLLNASNLEQVYALYLSMAGHQFYVLTLVDLGITICCDLANPAIWFPLTSLSEQTPQSVIALTRSGRVATAVVTNHGFSDGDPVKIAGATQDAYNGIVNIRWIDENTFSYLVSDSPATPATGTITAMGYDTSYFDAVAYATFDNLDLTLAEVSGVIYALDREQYQDTGIPIDVSLRTNLWDGGTDNKKNVANARPTGDRVASKILLRYNDADYDPDEWSTYREIDLDQARPQASSLASTVRRAYELRHTADTELRLEALETQEFAGYT